MTNSTHPKDMTCPRCHANMPFDEGYLPWCDQCEWNLQPEPTKKPANLFGSLYQSYEQKQHRKLFERLCKAQALKPRLTLLKVLAWGLAGSIQLITAALVIAGLYVFYKTGLTLLGIMAVLLAIGAGWMMRPRLAQLPKQVLSRTEFPALYRFVDAIRTSLPASQFDGVVMDEHFQAGLVRYGWQRKKILHIGLPLWMMLEGQERVALVSRELAYQASGSPRHELVVELALRMLSEWYQVLRPNELAPLGLVWSSDWRQVTRLREVTTQQLTMVNLFTLPSNLILLSLAGIVSFVTYLLARLTWQDSQQAEYLADATSATISGTNAALSYLNKLHLVNTLQTTIQRAAFAKSYTDFYKALQENARQVPPREIERIRRLERKGELPAQSSQPPTAFRTELIKAQPYQNPKIVVLDRDFEQIDQELSTLQEKIFQKIKDRYLSTLYH